MVDRRVDFWRQGGRCGDDATWEPEPGGGGDEVGGGEWDGGNNGIEMKGEKRKEGTMYCLVTT